jgi:hypothetical protein
MIRLPELDPGQGGEYRKATSVSRTLLISYRSTIKIRLTSGSSRIGEMTSISQFSPIDQRPCSLKFLKQVIHVYAPTRQDRPFMIERMVDDGTLSESSFDSMTDYLDIILE